MDFLDGCVDKYLDFFEKEFQAASRAVAAAAAAAQPSRAEPSQDQIDEERLKERRKKREGKLKDFAFVTALNCCAKRHCLKSFFTHALVEKIRNDYWGRQFPEHNFEKGLLQRVADFLKSHAASRKTENTHTVDGHLFDLRLESRPVCPTAFCQLTGISPSKLYAAVALIDKQLLSISDRSTLDDDPRGHVRLHPKKEAILAFLKLVMDNHTYFDNRCKVYRIPDVPKKAILYEIFRNDHRRPVSLPYFEDVWHKYFRKLVTDDKRPGCGQCAKFDLMIRAERVPEVKEELIRQKALHYQRARDHFVACDALQKELEFSPNPHVLLLVFDHMRAKLLPKKKRMDKSILMKTLLQILFCGLVDVGHNGSTTYYLFSEHWTETADSIISCLFSYIIDWVQTSAAPDNRKFIGQADGHATQRNRTVLAFFCLLVLCRILAEADLWFSEAGHSDSLADQRHSTLAKAIYNNEAFSIADFCSVGQQASKTHAFHLRQTVPIATWRALLDPCCTQFDQIMRYHRFRIKSDGIWYKEYDTDREWQGPVQHLTDNPLTHLDRLQLLPPTPLSEAKIESLRAVIANDVPADKSQFLQSIVDGGVGLSPDLIARQQAQLEEFRRFLRDGAPVNRHGDGPPAAATATPHQLVRTHVGPRAANDVTLEFNDIVRRSTSIPGGYEVRSTLGGVPVTSHFSRASAAAAFPAPVAAFEAMHPVRPPRGGGRGGRGGRGRGRGRGHTSAPQARPTVYRPRAAPQPVLLRNVFHHPDAAATEPLDTLRAAADAEEAGDHAMVT